MSLGTIRNYLNLRSREPDPPSVTRKIWHYVKNDARYLESRFRSASNLAKIPAVLQATRLPVETLLAAIASIFTLPADYILKNSRFKISIIPFIRRDLNLYLNRKNTLKFLSFFTLIGMTYSVYMRQNPARIRSVFRYLSPRNTLIAFLCMIPPAVYLKHVPEQTPDPELKKEPILINGKVLIIQDIWTGNLEKIINEKFNKHKEQARRILSPQGALENLRTTLIAPTFQNNDVRENLRFPLRGTEDSIPKHPQDI